MAVIASSGAAKPIDPYPDIKTSPKNLRITVGDIATTWYLIRTR